MSMDISQNDREVSEVDVALCRAALYRALALGFRPPAEETIACLGSKEGVAALEQAGAILDGIFGSNLTASIQALGDSPADLEELSSSYRRLFGHTASSFLPAYETEYGSGDLFQQPHDLSDLAGFYQAFGLMLDPGEHERADHVSCECEFLSFLALKEAYARTRDDSAMLEETLKAARLFLKDHLGRFVPAFAKRLTRESHDRFYSRLAAICHHFVIHDCGRLRVHTGPENLNLRPVDDERAPMACGGGKECIAMPGFCGPEEMEDK